MALAMNDLLTIRQGQALTGILPTIREEVAGMIKSTHVKAFELIRKGKLTPDEAVALWMELYSYDRLIKRFETKVKVSVSTAEANSNELNPYTGDDNG